MIKGSQSRFAECIPWASQYFTHTATMTLFPWIEIFMSACLSSTLAGRILTTNEVFKK